MSVDLVNIILVAAVIILAIVTVRLKEILFSAIALAAVSVIVAIMFFRLNSPYAGVFELSVCAGLITALFVSVTSLTRRE